MEHASELGPSWAADHISYRRQHDLVDAEVADEGLSPEQVVVVNWNSERQGLDFGWSHLDTMVLDATVDGL